MYSVGAYAVLIRQLIDVLGLPQVTVAGHDLGAAVAIELASTEPQSVKELVVVSVPLSDGVRLQAMKWRAARLIQRSLLRR
jgi:pimeloyl-ACP methyl ester carboxylesterase